jgi:hypothetical protein
MTPRHRPISHVRSSRSFGASILILVALLLSSQLALAQFTQQGPKLAGTGASGTAEQGLSVALSGDGNTAIVGWPGDERQIGAAWVFTRNNGVWTQQASKLVGNPVDSDARRGFSVALAGDGNTAIVGGPFDGAGSASAVTGAAWVHQQQRFLRPAGCQVGRHRRGWISPSRLLCRTVRRR